jgi:pyrroline-5-carboxylate reductase
MEQSGQVDKLPENLIDAGCAVSGCGPAFVFLFAEALADGGVACGLPRDKARQYAAQMIFGAADLLRQSGKCPGELKDAVCSPGGSTIAGLRELENHGFRGAAMDCVMAAYRKNLELGKQ